MLETNASLDYSAQISYTAVELQNITPRCCLFLCRGKLLYSVALCVERSATKDS